MADFAIAPEALQNQLAAALGELAQHVDLALGEVTITVPAARYYEAMKTLRDAPGWQEHTGVGLSGSVTGPWQTIWALDVGYAVRSDIPAARHNVTAGLVVLKLW